MKEETKENEEDNIFSPSILEKLEIMKRNNYKETYKQRTLCDIRINGQWTVGVVIKINDNTVLVKDYLLSGKIFEFNYFERDEITYFRNKTDPNDNKRKCVRNDEKTLYSIINYFNKFAEFNFGRGPEKDSKDFVNFTPYDYLNILRGKLFYLSDEVLCYSKQNETIGINLSLQFIKIILKIIQLFYDFAKENNKSVLKFQEILKSEFEDSILIIKNFAIISFLQDSFILLKRLFGHSDIYNDFYTQYENEIKNILDNQKENDLTKNIENICISVSYKKKCYLKNEKMQIPSRIISFSIDYFYSINGFDSLTDFLCSNIDFPFFYLQIFTQPFIQIKSMIGNFNDKLNNNIIKIWDYLDNKINKFSDEDLRKIKKENIFLIMKRLYDLCNYEENKKQQKFEKTYLIYINKCFNCKILEYQIYSMKCYNAIALAIKYNNLKTEDFDKSILQTKDNFIKYLSEKEYTQILNENQIINSILQKNIHEELIKQSYNIILISYENNFCLSDEIMIRKKSSDIFQSLYQKLIEAERNNEALQKIILDLFCKLAPFLIEEDKYLIFKNLQDYISFHEINNDYIDLLERYTFQCLNKIKKKEENEKNKNLISNSKEDNLNVFGFDEQKYYGLKMIWNYIQSDFQSNYSNDNNNFSNLVDQCIKSLKTILFIPDLNDSIREEILIKSFDNITNNKGSAQHIILIKELLEYEKLFKNFNSILEKLNGQINLFSIIINDLLNYYDCVSSIIKSESLSEEEFNDMKNLTYSGIFTHEMTIKIHIDLLITLMNKERNLNWEFNIFLKLWNKILKDKFSQKMICSILAQQISNIKDNFRDDIFNNIICNNDLFNIDKIETFRLYKKIIFGINVSNENFFILNKNDFKVNIDDLKSIIGYDKLWEILITNQNVEIQNECSDILCKICLGYKYPKKQESENYSNLFISTLLDNLNKAYDEKEKNEIAIKGILILVKKIFENISSSGSIIQNRNEIPKLKNNKKEEEEKNEKKKDNNENKGIIICLLFSGIKKKLIILNNYPFYFIRYSISNEFQIPLNNIKLQYQTKKKIIREFDLCDDFELFNQIVFKDEKINNEKMYTIKIINEHNPLIDLEKNPQKILTENENFQQKLTDLLKDKNKSYLNEVWNLVKEKMEKNVHIKNQIKKIVNENKEEYENEIVFDFMNTSVYYISYIISNINEIVQSEKNNNKFIENFISSKIFIKIKEMMINFSLIEYMNDERIFSEKIEIMKIQICLIEISEIISIVKNEEIYSLIIDKITQFIKEIFESKIKKDSLNPILYEKQIESLQKIINLINNSNNILIHFNKKFLTDENIKNNFLYFLDDFLIKSKNKEIKQKYKEFVFIIFNEKLYDDEQKNQLKEIITFMLNYFFDDDNLNKIINLAKESLENNFEFYFQIINKIIECSINLNLEFNYEEITKEKLLNPIIENSSFPQEIISGYFLLILTIISKLNISIDNVNNENFDFLNFIFEKCLFSKCLGDVFKHNTAKINSKKGFKYASNLFNYLIIKNPEKFDFYKNQLNDFHYSSFWRGNNFEHWNINVKDNLKNDYVGLKNLGCICYLNSLIQILFCIKPFRESIINSYCENEEKNVLYQLKYLFTSLKYYDTEYFIPIDFTQNFDDQKLNIREQMDMDEFFSLLFDKLENRLKGTDNENLIKYFFEIKISDDLTFLEKCSHHRSKEVSLLSVQLQVKGKKNLKESLDTFCEGELMKDDNAIYCEHCNNKFSAVKTQSFKKLPRILIFVLKRFEFDFQTFHKIKINDEYQFPVELDMTDYLHQNRKNQNNKNEEDDFKLMNNENENEEINGMNNNINKYKLKAVAVHNGNSEGGHYYAFIRTGNINEDNWYQFNDTKVSKFNIKDLGKETFGGIDTYIDPDTKNVTQFPSTRNAYLLFYEKENYDNCQNYDKVSINNDNYNIYNSPFFDKINEKMYQYNLQRIIFNPCYHKFLLEVCVNMINQFFNESEFEKIIKFSCRTKLSEDIEENEKKILGSCLNDYIEKGKIKLFNSNKINKSNEKEKFLDYFQFLLIYFFNVFIRSKEKGCLGGTIELIKFYMNYENSCAKFFIEEFTNVNILTEYIINCPFEEIKKIIIGLIFCAMYNVDNLYKPEIKKLKEEREKKEIERKKNLEIYKEKKKNLELNKEKKKDKNDEEYDGFVLFEKPIEEYIIDGIDIRNPIKEVYEFSPLLSDLIKNILKILEMLNLNKKASNFLFYIIYRFTLISEATRDYLVKKIKFLGFLTSYYFSNEKNPLQTTWEYFIPDHSILANLTNEHVPFETNFIAQNNQLYLVLLIYQLNISPVKLNNFHQYCNEQFTFKNKDYIILLFRQISTQLDASVFSNSICKICYGNKEFTSNVNEVIKELLNEGNIGNYRFFFLILKKYLIELKDNENLISMRINKVLRRLFKTIKRNDNIPELVNVVSTFILYLFVNYNKIMNKYFDTHLDNFKNLLNTLSENEEFYKKKINILQALINSKFIL